MCFAPNHLKIDETAWSIVQDGLHDALANPEGAAAGDDEADGVTKIDGIGTQMHVSYILNESDQKNAKSDGTVCRTIHA